MRPFTPTEARDLFQAIANASAQEAGRRFVLTVERASGAPSVAGHIVTIEDDQLGIVVEAPPENRGVQVEWDDIASVRVQAE